jgi:hypothetical protein
MDTSLRSIALLPLILGVVAAGAASGGVAPRTNGSLLYSEETSGKAQLFTVRPEDGRSFGLYVFRPDGTALRRVADSNAPQTGIDWGTAQ